MLEIKYTWTHNGDSGGLGSVAVPDGVLESALFLESSTIASTMSFRFQTGITSTGPWYAEASTSVSATATVPAADSLRVTGPYPFMRPYFPTKSSGTFTVVLMGAG